MQDLEQNSTVTALDERAIVLPEANSAVPLKEDFERMARRRFQNPKPARRGDWWVIQVRKDTFNGREKKRKNTRIRLAPATMSKREVQKLADEYLRPMNQGLESIGSATNFAQYVNTTYRQIVLPLMATTTRDRSEGILRNYLIPAFGQKCLRELTPMSLQAYFSAMAASQLSRESKDKLRDVLAGVLNSAVQFGLLVKNPIENVKLPPERRGKKRSKPIVTPEQFELLLSRIQEPYATMVYVAVYTGLRISELVGLRWDDIHEDSITVDERYCRGDWGAPKSSRLTPQSR
jgi:hypothetical protein